MAERYLLDPGVFEDSSPGISRENSTVRASIRLQSSLPIAETIIGFF